MFDAFLFFVLGAVTFRILQVFLAITPNFYIFKEAEQVSLYILLELHVQRITALKVLELAYEESDKTEDFHKIKTILDERYNILITKCISNLKSRLPYKVQYNSLEEAASAYRVNKEERRDGY